MGELHPTETCQRISQSRRGYWNTTVGSSRSEDFNSGLGAYSRGEKEISSNMERSIVIETNMLSRFTAVVGTIGSTAVYIGLFGTVLGIIRAFHDISRAGSGGISVVINGISEALICTAAGLCVAVPAVIAYNYFIKKIDNFVADMELCASETLDLISGKQK